MSREYSLSASLCTLQTAKQETIRARQHPVSPTGSYKSRGGTFPDIWSLGVLKPKPGRQEGALMGDEAKLGNNPVPI